MISVPTASGATNEGYLGLFSGPGGAWRLSFTCVPSATGFERGSTADRSITIAPLPS